MVGSKGRGGGMQVVHAQTTGKSQVAIGYLRNFRGWFTRPSVKYVDDYKKKRGHGPWIVHLNPCQEERMFTTKYKSHSPTLKSVLGITQFLTKAYQVTKFNQIILIRSISMSDLFTQPKNSGMCLRSNILIA